MKRREFVGAGLALTAAWPLRGFSAALKNVADVPVKTLAGGDVLIRGSSIEDFAASLRGHLLLQDHPDYEHTRHIWNAAFDRKPAMIASCTGASDVKRAVDFARENQLLTAVRAGGHSFRASPPAKADLSSTCNRCREFVSIRPFAGLTWRRVRCSASSIMNAPHLHSRPRQARYPTRAPPASRLAAVSGDWAGASVSPVTTLSRSAS
jgi:hypothetical protein